MSAKKTILVVDDERGPRESLRFVLKYDYNILTADRGPSGLEVLETQHVDLLITGIRMPHMCGVELLQIVREKYPDLPVLVLAGYGDLATAVKCIKLGAFDYIQKPFTIGGIQVTVGRALAYGDLTRSSNTAGSTPGLAEAQRHNFFNFKSFLGTKDDETILAYCNEHKGDETLKDLIPILQAQMSKNRKTILIVGDQRGPRESLRMVLKCDYEILLVDRARGGLEILKEKHVDLLITDIRMPEMHGIELLAIVRDKYPDLPVIIHTGYPDLATTIQCMKLDPFDYIERPFDCSEIQGTVRHALAYGSLQTASDANPITPEMVEAVLHKWDHLKRLFPKIVDV